MLYSNVFGFFTFSGVVMTGCLLGFGVASFIYRNYMDSLEDDEDEDVNEEDLDYEERYYEEFKNLSAEELSEETLNKLKNKYVQEMTPGGEVIMTYNNETESYHYWCNNRSIRYLTLDAVAQKFAIDHKCKAICVDYNEEYEKAKQLVLEKINKYLGKNKIDEENDEENVEKSKDSTDETNDSVDENKQSTEEKEKSVFAKFKSYNTKHKKEIQMFKDNPVVLPEKTNRFSYRGKISDWIESRENKEKEKSQNVKEIDFSTFKKIKTN